MGREHAQCEAAMNAGLQHALEAGRLLLEAKGLCKHGAWAEWLKENFRGSVRTAQIYMRAVRRWPEIEAKAQRSAHLSLDGAVKALAAASGSTGSAAENGPTPPELFQEAERKFYRRWPQFDGASMERAKQIITGRIDPIPEDGRGNGN